MFRMHSLPVPAESMDKWFLSVFPWTKPWKLVSPVWNAFGHGTIHKLLKMYLPKEGLGRSLCGIAKTHTWPKSVTNGSDVGCVCIYIYICTYIYIYKWPLYAIVHGNFHGLYARKAVE